MTTTRTLLDGIILGESPRWHDDLVWFCDWGAHEIRVAGLDGSSQVMNHVSAFPFCIDWQPDGRMLVVAGSDRMLLRAKRAGCGGSLEPYVDLRDLCDQPWNEVVVDGRGNAYLNCAGYEVMAGERRRPGILALVTPDGDVRQVAEEVFFPNGMAVTPDDGTLLVAESHAGRITAFDIGADGGLSGRRVWADLGDAAPDGICLDAEGAVWYADVPGKRCVRVCEGGTVLNVIDLDRGCFSCALGGTHGSTLFMTAARWSGTGGVGAESPTGVLLTAQAPAPGVGPGFPAANEGSAPGRG
jgi:sugar lactone lactonase YvrE